MLPEGALISPPHSAAKKERKIQEYRRSYIVKADMSEQWRT